MQGAAPSSAPPAASTRERHYAARRPWWLIALAVYSILLSLITGIPQFYYVLYGLHLVTIGPHSNLLGQVWYWFNGAGESGYVGHVDQGLYAGAVEDAFLLAPLYLATGIGLLARRRWVIPVGLMTGAMIFYGTLQLYIGDAFQNFSHVSSQLVYWLSLLPYMIYPLWLIPALLTRGARFAVRAPAQHDASRLMD
jgi:hypothetical protein